MTRTTLATIGDTTIDSVGPHGDRAPYGYHYEAIRNGGLIAAFDTVAALSVYVDCLTAQQLLQPTTA